MHIDSINLLNFKSYIEAELALHPKINGFVGNNGQGKTNLLDALFYLSMTKSCFNAIDSQNIRHGEEFFVIQGKYNSQGNSEAIYCAVKRGDGKVFKRNGKEYERMADHVGLIPLVIVSPADMSLILDGSDERRRYLNSVIAQYNKPYLEQVMRYNKLLASRNRLLKDSAGRHNLSYDLFEVIDEQMDALASSIHQHRVEFANSLTPIFQQHYSRVSSGAEEVKLEYQSHLAQGSLMELLRESLARDRALQYTSKGIHKDDLLLTLNGNPIKKEGSQGQQKTYLIALKLAQFQFMHSISGVKPILLLDDIFDKLDMQRAQQFIELVAQDSFGQIFITDTSPSRLDSVLSQIDSGYTLFDVSNGSITPSKSKT
jgi:DNA replication and repair protein RecF